MSRPRDLEPTALSVRQFGADGSFVFGWASVAHLDDVTARDTEDAIYQYVLTEKGLGRDAEYGRVVESFAVTPEKLQSMGLPPDAVPAGWWVGFKVTPETWAKVKPGVMKMLRVELEPQ